MSSNYFHFLEKKYPTLYSSIYKAEKFYPSDLRSASLHLRLYAEELLSLITEHDPIVFKEKDLSFFEKLDLIQKDYPQHRISNYLKDFHYIRIVSNKGVHGKNVREFEIEEAIKKAFFLALDLLFSPEEALKIEKSLENELISQKRHFHLSLEEVFDTKLNQDQYGCIKELSQFLNSPTEKIFLLKGDAGCGKTFLAKGIIDYLTTQGKTAILAAPTGRAAQKLSQKCYGNSNHAYTLHRLIYNFNVEDNLTKTDGLPKVYASIADNPTPLNSVYLIDEASLISDIFSENDFFQCGTGYLLRDFIRYVGLDQKKKQRKIIFLGDPSQLTPVGMNFAPALTQMYLKQNYHLISSEFYLKEVMRQTSDSEIYKNTKPLSTAIENKKFSHLNFTFGENVKKIFAEDIISLYLPTLKEPSSEENSIIITQTNREAAEINHAVRSKLFSLQQCVTSGDKIIIIKNTYSPYFFLNGEILKVGNVSPTPETRILSLKPDHEIKLSFRDIEVIREGDAPLTIKVLDFFLHNNAASLTKLETQALYVDFIMRFKASGQTEGDERARKLALLKDPYFNAIRAKFAYAITCHKAQGGEWNTVFVKFLNTTQPRTEECFRWVYTALTRSSQKLYLANPIESKIQIIGGNVSDKTPKAPSEEKNSSSHLLSEQEKFKNFLEKEISSAFKNTKIKIKDILHNQYQEAFLLEDENFQCRINISYNSKYKISNIRSVEDNALSRNALSLLSHLKITFNPPVQHQNTDTLPNFIKEYNNILEILTQKENIQTTFQQELPFGCRYLFSKEKAICTMDIFYNKNQQFTKAMPISPKRGEFLEKIQSIIENSLSHLNEKY